MNDRRNLLRESLTAIERLQARLDASERSMRQPIAIIGAGCRYPGGIENPEELWRVVYDGVDVVSEVPPDRWDVEAYYDLDPRVPGKMITRKGGFLSQVDRFDPQFFGISPREATTMDPQQRLLLETACEAIESAGLPVDRLAGSATGVFIGITTSDYGNLVRLGAAEQSDLYSVTGNALNVAAGRLSFTFGFQGPCVAVDTACSSSLVAVHLACQSLRAGESDFALAGGVNVILSPDATVLFSKWGMMAPDGACKTFDAAANGFVRSEGCAVIALKRLSDAAAAGDPILALIRGSAVNSDGRSSGLTVPNGLAQQALLAKALASAGLSPVDIDYVEAHGTGTGLGDPIEVEALGAVLCQGRPADRPLMIGSVKTNLGHTEAASGVAGLVKVIMALRHEAIPPHLHFSTPNPGISWKEFPITVPTTVTSWSRGKRPRRAGVSSFGFSGTNAHVIVEEAPLRADTKNTPAPGPFLVPLSARDDAALREIALRNADFLAADMEPPLADIATTAASGRSHMVRRLALLTDSTADLERELRTFASGRMPASAVEGALRTGQQPKIAFLFTGQGSQYAGMGRGLYEDEPIFRSALDRMAAILQHQLDRPLLEVMFENAAAAPLTKTAYTQPALFALEYALAELWRSWGITPAVVLGHSVGEYAAACVAGVFSPEDGLSLIAERGRLMQELPAGGAMAAVFAKEAQVSARLASHGDQVVIAAVNGPDEVVISGSAATINEIVASLLTDGITSRTLDVSHAFHSPYLEPVLNALERRAASIAHSVPRIPLLSNLTGAPFPADMSPDAAYWRRHAREPVRFAACVDTLLATGVDALIEIGPHPTLLALLERAAPGAPWANISSLRKGRDDRREMLSSLAKLYVRGTAVQWDAVNAHRGGHRVSMPTYPFQRERYWVATNPAGRLAAQAGHPLLGEQCELASSPGTFVWERAVSLDTHPWLRDHLVQGAAIVPASAYVEMALAAGGSVLGSSSLSLQQIEYLKPIILHEGVERLFQATLTLGPDGVALFVMYSRLLEREKKGAPDELWTAHVTAKITAIESSKLDTQGLTIVDTARERCGSEVNMESFYSASARNGNQWGPSFRGLNQIWIGEREAVGHVHVPPSIAEEMVNYRFHPAVADACSHALVATMSLGSTNGAFVGAGVNEVRFHRSPVGRTLWTHAKLRPQDGDDSLFFGDVNIYDETGALVSEALGARIQNLDKSLDSSPPIVTDDWYYEVLWQPQQLGGPRMRSAETGPWLVFADRCGVAERISAHRNAAGLQTILVARGDQSSINGDRAIMRPEVPEDYQRLLETVGKSTVIVYLWSLDAFRGATTVDSMAEALALGPEGLLYLLRGLQATASFSRPRIWLVTSCAQAVVSDDKCDAPWNATLWGLGKALSAEHSELWGGLVDLTPGLSAEIGADHLIREIEGSTAEDKVAYRERRRYVARLVRRRPPPCQTAEFVARLDGTYLITGGLGGIGLAMARWLVERGARQLLLVGRTPLPPRETWIGLDPASGPGRRAAAVSALEALGADVETAAVDVAVDGELEQCLEARRARGAPQVCGVFHAAGLSQLQPLATQDVASLRRAFAGKMFGAWRLHQVFLNAPLDCFVLCSSISALLTPPLLGGYAAGNSFLDALAHHRRAYGLSALSINWGSWGEVGMAADAILSAGGGMPKGVGTISTAKGIAALSELLEAGDTQAAVIPIDWQEFGRAYPAFMSDPFLQAMVDGADRRDQRSVVTRLSSLVAEPADTHKPLVGNYLRAEAARVLGMPPDGIDIALPLSIYGFDSLMAVQLKNRIEADLGAVVPLIQLLQGQSVEQLLPSVIKAVQTGSSVAVSGESPDFKLWEEGTL